MTNKNQAIIIGAGPAGLTTAYELQKHGILSSILEADEVVGGLARTVNYNGYLFDIGGHRFFTKWEEVNDLWHEILGPSFLPCKRLSRIYYRNRYFGYPLKPFEALAGLGWSQTARVLGSYLKAQLKPNFPEDNFEQWVCNRFGKRLFETFFKTYTEKVWGIPCTEISAEWAAQRIKGLSLASAIHHAIFRGQNGTVKTLVDRFHYPEKGPGQMWETLADRLLREGCQIRTNSPVTRISHHGGQIDEVAVLSGSAVVKYHGAHYISSMPIRDLINALHPAPPAEIVEAANALQYRDFLIVSLIVNRKHVMPDNWIYIHDPRVNVGRIQNFKNWSSAMVPDQSKTCLGMEYFVFENDKLWAETDQKLIEMAKRELQYLRLAEPENIEDGTVVRMRKAYPVYSNGWAESLRKIRNYLARNAQNLQLVGRNGMHKYNNQDHSMMTGLYAARNILGASYDLWAVNTEFEYHEAGQAAQQSPGHGMPTRSKQRRPRAVASSD